MIATAETIITEKGLDAFSLRVLSRHIGVSHTAVYRHFQSKQELFCALAQDGFQEMEKRFSKIYVSEGCASLQRIRAIGKAYVEFALENAARYRIMFSNVLPNQELTQELRQAAETAFNHLRRAIEHGQESGGVRMGDPLELTSVGWSMAHGIAQLLLDGQFMSQEGGQAAPALIAATGMSGEQDLTRLINVALDTMTAGFASGHQV